jgi:hypothetical protein
MRILIATALVAAALPAAASAANPHLQYYIPPGNSAANEYVEGVPTASGSTSANRIGHRVSGGQTSSAQAQAPVLAPATQQALATQGTDGARAAAIASATAPPNMHRRTSRHHAAVVAVPSQGGGSSGGGGGSSGSGSSGGGAAPIGSVARALTGSGISGGLGTGLPVALVLTAIAIAGVAFSRRRRTS